MIRLQILAIPIFLLSAVIAPVNGSPTVENLMRMLQTSNVPEKRCPYADLQAGVELALEKRGSVNPSEPVSGMSKVIPCISGPPVILMRALISFGTTCIPTTQLRQRRPTWSLPWSQCTGKSWIHPSQRRRDGINGLAQ